jgi:hypothetical protein
MPACPLYTHLLHLIAYVHGGTSNRFRLANLSSVLSVGPGDGSPTLHLQKYVDALTQS